LQLSVTAPTFFRVHELSLARDRSDLVGEPRTSRATMICGGKTLAVDAVANRLLTGFCGEMFAAGADSRRATTPWNRSAAHGQTRATGADGEQVSLETILTTAAGDRARKSRGYRRLANCGRWPSDRTRRSSEMARRRSWAKEPSRCARALHPRFRPKPSTGLFDPKNRAGGRADLPAGICQNVPEDAAQLHVNDAAARRA